MEFGYGNNDSITSAKKAAVVVKHTNPCGVAIGDSISNALYRALEADRTSAFGGIVAINCPVDEAAAKELEDIFIECIVAPYFDNSAKEILSKKKSLRLLELKPESIKKEIVDPYISIKDNQARINLRIIDSKKELRRNKLIKKIQYDLENKLNLKKDEFKLAGVLILFNNLLQSLFKSQILTLGVVMAGITLMFLILFRNITLSLIGVVPNFMAAFLILGIIGLLGIPLDMMTITIAAITIGIAVANSIHYIYRFKEEFKKIKNYNQTLKKCHDTVGVAILNTSITIVFGFSILVLSNFIPTIYFGIFTGIAMMLAMISVLTLLPSLILLFKPFGEIQK